MFAIFVFHEKSDGDPRNHIFVKQQNVNDISVSKLPLRIKHFYNVFLSEKPEHWTANANIETAPGSILQHRLGSVKGTQE